MTVAVDRPIVVHSSDINLGVLSYSEKWCRAK